MDVIFDIDSTIADPTHRLRFIADTAYFKPGGVARNLKPDWDTFLSPEQLIQDKPILPMWDLMFSLIWGGNRILLITGRKESCREATMQWIQYHSAGSYSVIYSHLLSGIHQEKKKPALYMRADDDRRPSHEVKQAAMMRAIDDGFRPVVAFDDRKSDAEMWRRNGLICAHIAEGGY